ncbi:MAG TPA: hypothetical protein PLZ45_14130 [Ferruginibacter sp.]|nr:hypothetical protein [Chitinophagaceae bacterium]HRI25811.1 hypothetical protein [Ferruginibacter sp.]
MKRKPAFIPVCILFLLIISCRQQPVFSQKTGVYDLVKDFKARPDNKTDNYPAFVKAAEVISRAGGGVLNIPKGNYYIAGYKIIGGDKKNGIDDIIFKNCNNLTIIGNNSTIRVNGSFSRNKDTRIKGLPYEYAYTHTVCPFKLVGCKNVLLKDISLYGEVDRMRKQEGVVEGISYGVFIADEEPAEISSNIVLQNITAHHFAADGFIIKSNGSGITISNCRSYCNARQGLSIVKGSDIKVLNSSFDSTGKTGAYGWHAPGAGIDVENEFGPGLLKNVLIRNCNLRGNSGFQVVTTLSSENVTIDSCFISDPTGGYSDALKGVGMYSLNSTLSNSVLFAGIQVDLADQIYKGPVTQQISKNIIYSGDRLIVSSDFSRPVDITDNILVMLPKPRTDAYSPYIQNTNCVFNRNIVVVHADRFKKEPHKITALVQFVKEAADDFWLVNWSDVPLEKQNGFSFFTAMNDSRNTRNQFCAPGARVSRTEFFKTGILSATQVNEILSKEFITAYRQNGLNKKFLMQANEVRNYAKAIIATPK